jgi:hypothetical protein
MATPANRDRVNVEASIFEFQKVIGIVQESNDLDVRE